MDGENIDQLKELDALEEIVELLDPEAVEELSELAFWILPENGSFQFSAGPDERSAAQRIQVLVELFGRESLARAAGSSIQTIRRCELGDSMNSKFIESIVRNLGVSAEWILRGAGPIREEERCAEALQEFSLGECLGELVRRASVA